MLDVTYVRRGSAAYKAGIRKGDKLLRICGEACSDFIDYEYLTSGCSIEVEYRKKNGKVIKKTVYKNECDDFGIEYPQCRCRACCNSCVFCFVDQLPDGMRDSLYFKDDDWRMSFLMGNYVTLTNVGDREFNRILKRKVSPLYISVHATDKDVRSLILGNKKADILPRLRALSENGIYFDCQAVLVPGLNDGDILRKTISDLLDLYPYARSLALVPVGITCHRDGLYPLSSFTVEQARDVIAISNEFAKISLEKLGTRFVFPSDEMYMRAKLQLPDISEYEGLLQKEDGVGFVSSFFSEAYEALDNAPNASAFSDISIACGVDIAPLFEAFAIKCTEKTGMKIYVYPIKNEFFGKSVTVSGLITGADIVNQLKGQHLGQRMFISKTMLRQFEDVFLDNVTLSELCDILKIDVCAVEPDGYAFMQAITNCED